MVHTIGTEPFRIKVLKTDTALSVLTMPQIPKLFIWKAVASFPILFLATGFAPAFSSFQFTFRKLIIGFVLEANWTLEKCIVFFMTLPRFSFERGLHFLVVLIMSAISVFRLPSSRYTFARTRRLARDWPFRCSPNLTDFIECPASLLSTLTLSNVADEMLV